MPPIASVELVSTNPWPTLVGLALLLAFATVVVWAFAMLVRALLLPVNEG